MANDALDRQIGGDHYKGAKIQVVEFWQRNRWDGCACSTMKYLARYRQKNGVEDLRKARHYVELRQELEVCLPGIEPPVNLPMHRFIDANGITDDLDITALLQLERYVQAAPDWRHIEAAELIEAIDTIIARYCAEF